MDEHSVLVGRTVRIGADPPGVPEVRAGESAQNRLRVAHVDREEQGGPPGLEDRADRFAEVYPSDRLAKDRRDGQDTEVRQPFFGRNRHGVRRDDLVHV